MSYEPTIIVERKDLDKYETELMSLDVDENEVGKYLYQIINDKSCKFKKLELYMFQPEFSNFNKKVRDWLDKHDIEYGIDY